MKYLLIALLLLMPGVLADDILSSRNAITQVTITDNIEIVRQGGYSQVNFVDANLTWYPRTDKRQEVLDQRFTPEVTFQEGIALFHWDKPIDSISYQVVSQVLTDSDYFEVDRLVEFPIKNLDEELIPYTFEREIIDINDDIKKTAASIASGKNDLFEVVYSLAEYTRNTVEYNLSTINVDASQKASWVLENKRGVCDELTSLFVSMVRSLGIPAKFVSGVSYSNLDQFDEEWQAHGWSEVYFPDVGWIPFDVTYGEYGYLDASHIKFKEDFDAGNRAASYSGRGKAFSFGSGDFDIDVEIEETTGRQAPGLEVFIEPIYSNVGFGSYNVFKVDVNNIQEYYVTDKIRFSVVEGLEIFKPESEMIMLKPLERKQIMILAKVDDNLNSGYSYAFPQQIQTDRGVKAGTSFRVEESGRFIDKITAQELLSKEEVSLGFGSINCILDSEFVYINDLVRISCDTAEEGVVCFNDDCRAHNFTFEYIAKEIGYSTLQADFYSSGSLKGSSFFSLEVLETASVKIEDFGINKTIEYGGYIPVKFKFSTIGRIKNLKIDLEHENFVFTQRMTDVNEGTHEYTFMIDTSTLTPGVNTLNFHFEYTDLSGEIDSSNQKVSFEMINSPWYQHIWAWLQKTTRKLFN